MTQTKTLIAIVNARSRGNWRDAIRKTWLPPVPREKADAFFFVGHGEPLVDGQGVVELDCSDKYEHLPEKIRAIARWSVSQEYAHTLKIDDDTVLRPSDFLSSGYDQFPYVGRSNRPESPYAVPYGFFYCMDRKCTEIVANYDLPPDGSNDDEKHVEYNLSLQGIKLQDERRVYLHQFILPEDVSHRPLRAPKRSAPDRSMWGPQQVPGTFAWCVHIGGEIPSRIKEYHKLFALCGEK